MFRTPPLARLGNGGLDVAWQRLVTEGLPEASAALSLLPGSRGQWGFLGSRLPRHSLCCSRRQTNEETDIKAVNALGLLATSCRGLGFLKHKVTGDENRFGSWFLVVVIDFFPCKSTESRIQEPETLKSD